MMGEEMGSILTEKEAWLEQHQRRDGVRERKLVDKVPSAPIYTRQLPL